MNGFFRISAAVPNLKVADSSYNTDEIINLCDKANKKNVEFLVFPQLAVTGITAGDLFFQDSLIEGAKKGLSKILDKTKKMEMLILVGAPYKVSSGLINGVFICYKGKILSIASNFDLEKRYFMKEKRNMNIYTFSEKGENIDIDNLPDTSSFLMDNISLQHKFKYNNEDLTFNICFSKDDMVSDVNINIVLDSSFAHVGKTTSLEKELKYFSRYNKTAIVYVNPGMFESTTDGVMSGNTFICQNGEILKKDIDIFKKEKLIVADISTKIKPKLSKNQNYNIHEEYLNVNINRKKENLLYKIEKNPFVPEDMEQRNNHMEEIFNIQTAGLMKRMLHIGCKKAVVAVSGGLDSTLALLVVYNVFTKLKYDYKNIIGITMPGFGTSKRTFQNGHKLMDNLKIDKREISIKASTTLHLKEIGHDGVTKDTTYENAQARERMQIAMDVANMEDALVVGTGDLSELVLGFTTYNGDHMSMYSVNSGLPKTVVRAVTTWAASNTLFKKSKDILNDVVNTPVSPELLPTSKDGEITQITEDILGPYELNDFFIYYVLKKGYNPITIAELAFFAYEEKYDLLMILKYLKQFYIKFITQQFKRSCLPDGVAVGSISISPRTSLKMPSDASLEVFIAEIEEEIKKQVKKG